MSMKKFYLVAAVAALFASTSFAQQSMQPSNGGVPVMPPFPMTRTITVLATGTASTSAQHVSLAITVSGADQTATGLFVKQKDIIKHLKDALEGAGIKSEDITEQPFHLLPNMEYGQNGTRIIGYRMDTPLEVQLDNVDDLPRIIDLSTQSGASAITVGGFSAPGQLLHAEAVKNAIENARKEAASIAQEMGAKVGPIASISETGPQVPIPQQGGEEEQEHRQMAQAEQPNSLSETANLKVVFQVQ